MLRFGLFFTWLLVSLTACSTSADDPDPGGCLDSACTGGSGAGAGGQSDGGSGAQAGAGVGGSAGGVAGSSAGESGSGAAGAGGVGGSAGEAGEAGAAGEGGAAGTSAGTGGGGSGGMGGSGGECAAQPLLLSQTGLYQADGVSLAEGVLAYTPRFALWSDNAEKRRWIALPQDTQIDSSDMDFWNFPIGTKLWKEFSRDNVRVETRLIEKDCNGEWLFMPYLWDEDQKEARAVPAGVMNARGTLHDVPSQADCRTCHEGTLDRVLGFSALQLSHALEGVTLAQLRAQNLLTAPPDADFQLPGTDNEQAVLGYLHANCGHCHNPYAPAASRTTMELFLESAKLSSVATTTTYLSTVERQVQQGTSLGTCVVKPQSLSESVLYTRMELRVPPPSAQMPPLASEDPDTTALGQIATWINALPLQPDGACSQTAPGAPTRSRAPQAHTRRSLSQRVGHHAQQ